MSIRHNSAHNPHSQSGTQCQDELKSIVPKKFASLDLPIFAIVSFCMLIRCAIGVWGYSGYQTPPMYGDFEAQRHWMEVTTSIPIGEW